MEKHTSPFNPVLEITMQYGTLVLNTENANYSRGSLHAVMNAALKLVYKNHGCAFKNILILGYGGGSAAYLIREKFNPDALITAVEIDAKVIEIAKKWFPVKDVTITEAEANDYLANSKNKYDLIICDIFVDTTMPDFTLSQAFYKKISNSLEPGGVFIQNLMVGKSDVLRHLETLSGVLNNTGVREIFGANWLLFGTM